MGIVFPTSVYTINDDEIELLELLDNSMTEVSTNVLRVSNKVVINIVKGYNLYSCPPMLDYLGLYDFIMNINKKGSASHNDHCLIYISWKLYSVDSVCYIQDILTCLILLSEGKWRDRLSLLFDVFKCTANSELGYNDVIVVLQSCSQVLHRLWPGTVWEKDQWETWIISMTDALYAKLEKDTDDYVNRSEFIDWATERFKGSTLVSSPDTIHELYSASIDTGEPDAAEDQELDFGAEILDEA